MKLQRYDFPESCRYFNDDGDFYYVDDVEAYLEEVVKKYEALIEEAFEAGTAWGTRLPVEVAFRAWKNSRIDHKETK